MGGTEDQRLQADRDLYQCILDKTNSKYVAGLYYIGPRLFGSPYTNRAYRWGFGWEQNRFYSPMNEDLEDIRDQAFLWVQSLSDDELVEIVKYNKKKKKSSDF